MRSKQIIDIFGVLFSRIDILRRHVSSESVTESLRAFNVLLVENSASEIVRSNCFQTAKVGS